jgi:peptidylprolyl isomerase
VTYFNDVSPRITRLRPRAGAGLAMFAAVALIAAGCGGSSSSSSSIGVGVENKSEEKLATAGAPTPAKAATTPTSGPLSKEPSVTPPSGPAPSKLVVKEIIPGTGSEAKSGEMVTVNYVGVLYNGGKVFDASWKRKEPFQFTLGQGQVIPGWDQGVAGMKVGGRRELIIPSALGYGKTGSPPAIPANAPLVFVVDLLGT